MKKMIYGERREQPEVLYSGEYRGHKFAILNLGSHPTAYIENKMAITDYYDCRLDNVEVHGGFTYCDTGHLNEESNKMSWLGWDYAHSGDFMGYYSTDDPFYYQTKQWTTAEIYDEVKSVIDQIITIEEYNDSQEYKEIRDMILAAENNDSDIQRACKKLYATGYRKQSDTVREFVRKLFDISKEQAKGGVYTIKPWPENIINLAKEYGVED